MQLDEKRLAHSLAVARKMKSIAESRHPGNAEYAEGLFVLGLMHDIGYEFAEKQEEHPKTGGELLKRQNYKYWKEICCHGKPASEYQSEELNILNVADLTTDPCGKEVSAEARLADIADRYGSQSRQFLDAEQLAKELNLIR